MVNLTDFIIGRAIDTFNATQNGTIGRVLTIIDASISDKTQREAIKDLLKQAIYSTQFVSNYKEIVSYIKRGLDKENGRKSEKTNANGWWFTEEPELPIDIADTEIDFTK